MIKQTVSALEQLKKDSTMTATKRSLAVLFTSIVFSIAVGWATVAWLGSPSPDLARGWADTGRISLAQERGFWMESVANGFSHRVDVSTKAVLPGFNVSLVVQEANKRPGVNNGSVVREVSYALKPGESTCYAGDTAWLWLRKLHIWRDTDGALWAEYRNSGDMRC